MKKIRRYINTLRYLKPIQIVYQVKKRIPYSINIQKTECINEITTLNFCIPEIDTDCEYLKRFSVELILSDEILLLNEVHKIDLSNWKIKEEDKYTHLWKFNLHYFEYGIALAEAYKRTGKPIYYNKLKDIINSWIDVHQKPKGDAWQAYTISLRIPNWLIALDLCASAFGEDEDFKKKVYGSIFEQYQWIIHHQEKHLLGNHYFENIKVIILCCIVFKEKRLLEQYLKKLLNEIQEQILPDGMHYERSVMYHKIILEDLIRLGFLIQQSVPEKTALLSPSIQKMVDCLYSLEKGMGKVPFFNDSADGVAKETSGLLLAAKRLYQIVPVETNVFSSAGYCKLYNGNKAVIFDAGEIGPSYQPGHSHCDTLSFEMSMDGKPFIVNSGTYQYQDGLRPFFRSTQAHNTVTINDEDQFECWGEHRVARRSHNTHLALENSEKCSGFFTDIQRNTHYRQLRFMKNGNFIVMDRIIPNKSQRLSSYIHFAPGITLLKDADRVIVCDSDSHCLCVIKSINQEEIILHKDGIYSPEFGVIQKKEVIEFKGLNNQKASGYLITFSNKKDNRKKKRKND